MMSVLDIFFLVASVKASVEISNGCTIGAMCQVESAEILPENTVIYGRTCQRVINGEKPVVI